MIKWTQGEWGQQSKGAYVPPAGEFGVEERPSKRGNEEDSKQSGGSTRHEVSERPPSASSRRESSSYAESSSNKRSFSDVSASDRSNDTSFRQGGPSLRRSSRLDDDEDMRRTNFKSGQPRASNGYDNSRDPPLKSNSRDRTRESDERGNRDRGWERTSSNNHQDTFREPANRGSSREHDRGGWNTASSRVPAEPIRRPVTPERRDFRGPNAEREWRDSSRERNVSNAHTTRSSASFSNSTGYHDRTPIAYSSRSRSKNRQGSPVSNNQRSTRDSRDLAVHSKGVTSSSRSDMARPAGNFDARGRGARSDDLRGNDISSPRNSDMFNGRPRTPPRHTEEFPKPRRLGTFPDSNNARTTDHQNDYRDRRPVNDIGSTEDFRDSRGSSRNLDAGNSRPQRDFNYKPSLDSSKTGSNYPSRGSSNSAGSSSTSRAQRPLVPHDDRPSQRTAERVSSSTSKPTSGSGGFQAITRDGKAPIMKRTLGFKKRVGVPSSSQGDLPSRPSSSQQSSNSNERRGDDALHNEDRKRPPQVVRRPQVVRKRQIISPSSSRPERPNRDSPQPSYRDQAISRTSVNPEKRQRTASNNLVDSKLNSSALRLESSETLLSDRGTAALTFLDLLLSSSQPDVAPAKSAAVLFLQSLSLSLLAEDSKIQENHSTVCASTSTSINEEPAVAQTRMGNDEKSSFASSKDELALTVDQTQVRENGSLEQSTL